MNEAQQNRLSFAIYIGAMVLIGCVIVAGALLGKKPPDHYRQPAFSTMDRTQ
jgi:hypothetical protein